MITEDFTSECDRICHTDPVIEDDSEDEVIEYVHENAADVLLGRVRGSISLVSKTNTEHDTMHISTSLQPVSQVSADSHAVDFLRYFPEWASPKANYTSFNHKSPALKECKQLPWKDGNRRTVKSLHISHHDDEIEESGSDNDGDISHKKPNTGTLTSVSSTTGWHLEAWLDLLNQSSQKPKRTKLNSLVTIKEKKSLSHGHASILSHLHLTGLSASRKESRNQPTFDDVVPALSSMGCELGHPLGEPTSVNTLTDMWKLHKSKAYPATQPNDSCKNRAPTAVVKIHRKLGNAIRSRLVQVAAETLHKEVLPENALIDIVLPVDCTELSDWSKGNDKMYLVELQRIVRPGIYGAVAIIITTYLKEYTEMNRQPSEKVTSHICNHTKDNDSLTTEDDTNFPWHVPEAELLDAELSIERFSDRSKSTDSVSVEDIEIL